MRNKNILVFGSTGFIGRSLTKRLLADGSRLICPVRNPNRVKRNILSGDIGQIDVVKFDLQNLEIPFFILSIDFSANFFSR